MSLRIAPPSSHPTTTTNTTSSLSSKGAPSAPGIHDTLRSSLPSTTTTTTQPTSTHPLESRLSAWRSTQDALKMTTLRRTFGLAEPIRRGMELKIAREGEWRPMALGGSAGVSGDILSGRDGEVAWEDVFRGDETRESVDVHAEMERKLRMDW
ncbi:MAG: hypothetical protein LQ338_004066 [Usnochroma carphineum]|nr:MAG: hypothetical protein LQ338_004066 [Usnochroma carphineum]